MGFDPFLRDLVKTRFPLVTTSATTDLVLRTRVTADVNDRFNVDASGKMTFGPATTATDLTVERGASGGFKITPTLTGANDVFINAPSGQTGALILAQVNAVTKFQANAGGAVSSAAAESQFGVGAFGTGNFVAIGDEGDLNYGIVIGTGSQTNVGLKLRSKGTLTQSIVLEDSTDTALLSLRAPYSGIASGNTAISILAYHNGTALAQQPVTLGAADSGGVGFKLLRVPN